MRNIKWKLTKNIDGNHLIPKRVGENQLHKEVYFSTTSFWVQAHNLPLEYLLKENAKIIGNSMGKFLEVDLVGAENAQWGNFLRFKVEVKSTNPLTKGFWLDRAPLEDPWV